MNRKLYDKLIFELSRPGRHGADLPSYNYSHSACTLPEGLLRETAPELPEVDEPTVVRHYTNSSTNNFGVDTGFYPLGSCTMKYNPKVDEAAVADAAVENLHPAQPADSVQGALKIYRTLEKALAEVGGMAEFSLNPFAGAHGEYTGLMVIRRYFLGKGDETRTRVLVPDSAHGTNPASAAMAGFEVVEVKSLADGTVDIDDLAGKLDSTVAALMMTNPNTVGMFEKGIPQIASLVHDAGALLYYDGANLNPMLGIAINESDGKPECGNGAFGRVSSWLGNYTVYIKALAYILTMGAEGLAWVGPLATLNANYVKESLKDLYLLPIDGPCKHEFVFDGLIDKSGGVTTLNVAKRLLDYGFHAPTIYFPLLFHESLMVEPTETESPETLDAFIEAMRAIAHEAKENPEFVKNAPYDTPVSHPDEDKAALEPCLTYAELMEPR